MILDYTTELYALVDNFFKILLKLKEGKKLFSYWYGKRGPKRNLSLSEIVTLNILRFSYRIEDLKTYHKILKQRFKDEFPEVPNYENFLKATNLSIGFIVIFIKYLLTINSKHSNNKHFIDSTDIAVCKNYNIYRHKVAKNYAERGKTSKGWFYGFKIHGVCDLKGNLENIFITSGNVHDNQVLNELLKKLEGLFICDSGYLLKPEDLEKFLNENKQFFIATRKNMRRVMTKEQHDLFKKRSIIETNWDVLKERFKIVYSYARSIFGLLRHYIYSLVSFMLYRFDPKKMIDSQFFLLNY